MQHYVWFDVVSASALLKDEFVFSRLADQGEVTN